MSNEKPNVLSNNLADSAHKILMGRVKGVMVRQGISNAAMASELGVHESTVSRWISGQLEISFRNYIRICQHLNITLY